MWVSGESLVPSAGHLQGCSLHDHVGWYFLQKGSKGLRGLYVPEHPLKWRVCFWLWVLKGLHVGKFGVFSKHPWIAKAFWMKGPVGMNSCPRGPDILEGGRCESCRLWGPAGNVCSGRPEFFASTRDLPVHWSWAPIFHSSRLACSKLTGEEKAMSKYPIYTIWKDIHMAGISRCLNMDGVEGFICLNGLSLSSASISKWT